MTRLVLLVGFLFATAANAAPPTVLEAAFKAYGTGGAAGFVAALFKGSPVAPDVTAQVNGLEQIESYYGGFESWEVLDECELTDRVRNTFYVAYFDRGPVFGYVTTYRINGADEVMTSYQIHTEIAAVFPAGWVGGDVCED